MPARTKYVGRPGPFGNPFAIGEDGINSNEEAVAAFEEWIGRPEQAKLVGRAKRELAGYDLCCWCSLDQRCHADIWLKIVNVHSSKTRALKLEKALASVLVAIGIYGLAGGLVLILMESLIFGSVAFLGAMLLLVILVRETKSLRWSRTTFEPRKENYKYTEPD